MNEGEDAPWRAYNHVTASAENTLVFCSGKSAYEGGNLEERGGGSDVGYHSGGLQRDLSSGGEDKGLGEGVGRVDSFDDGNGKDQGLPGACFGLDNEVEVEAGQGDGGLLDGRWASVSGV